jgi:hypothetical protein
MVVIILRERIRGLATVGVVGALASIILFSVSSGSGDAAGGPWLILALIVMVAWGVQACSSSWRSLALATSSADRSWRCVGTGGTCSGIRRALARALRDSRRTLLG